VACGELERTGGHVDRDYFFDRLVGSRSWSARRAAAEVPRSAGAGLAEDRQDGLAALDGQRLPGFAGVLFVDRVVELVGVGVVGFASLVSAEAVSLRWWDR